jgi:sugar-specific transcriptional regulator TrmB
MLQNEDIEALTSVGLTVLQAKVYLALATLGQETVRTISKNAGVARQDIYRISSELQKLGLVEKVIAAPNEFKAIPLTEGISILLQRVHEERVESHKKIVKLMRRYKDSNVKANFKESQFILVPEKELRLRMRKIIENTQTSIDTITTLNNFRYDMPDFDRIFKKALKRGVKFRFIIDIPENANSLPEISMALTKNPLLKIRYITTSSLCALSICDKKESIIAISETCGIGINKTPALWSNNPCFLRIAQNYFEMTWTTAMESERQVSTPNSRNSEVISIN